MLFNYKRHINQTKSFSGNIMKIINTSIQDVYIIEPDVFKDARGYFLKAGIKPDLPKPA